ncbi:exo-beta-N-acetylmuramidase NamZ domain-containing protein [Dyadobacter jiangsuensis]
MPIPTKEQLADIDLLVFDIQDVGCRYYINIFPNSGNLFQVDPDNQS